MSKNIALVMGSFHKNQVEEMVDEAHKIALRLDLNIVKEVWVPGSMEKPLAVKRLFQLGDIDGVVVLGIIERGDTKHGLVMGHVIGHALMDIELEFTKPIGYGILGPEILPEQIEPRLRKYARKAVRALAEML